MIEQNGEHQADRHRQGQEEHSEDDRVAQVGLEARHGEHLAVGRK